MGFCTSCGAIAGSGAFCGNCGAAANRKEAAPPSASIADGELRDPSTGGVVTLIVFGVLGGVSSWLPWVRDTYGNSFNGWDSQEGLGFADKFSSGTTISVVGSVCTLVVGAAIFSRQKSPQAQPLSKAAVGWMLIVSGLASMLGAGANFNGWDEIASDAGEILSAGIGMQLAAISGLAVLIMGIVALTSRTFVQGRRRVSP